MQKSLSLYGVDVIYPFITRSQSLTFHWVLISSSESVVEFEILTFPSLRSLILLSLNSTLTKQFLSTLHITYKHAGISALMSVILETYYISGLRNFLKLISRRCPMCQKAYSRPLNQRMPLSRTTPAPPFERTEMDFAGPFYIRQGKVRKPTRVKCYACLFICLTTKAVHIELCANLTRRNLWLHFIASQLGEVLLYTFSLIMAQTLLVLTMKLKKYKECCILCHYEYTWNS